MLGISSGLLALIVFLVIWLALGHFFVGLIVALCILAFGGGYGYYSRP